MFTYQINARDDAPGKPRLKSPAPIKSLSALAAAIGRGKTSAHRWTHHPDWTWPRVPPWDSADVPAMIAWAGEHLQDRDTGGDYAPADPATTAEVKRLRTLADLWDAGLRAGGAKAFTPSELAELDEVCRNAGCGWKDFADFCRIEIE